MTVYLENQENQLKILTKSKKFQTAVKEINLYTKSIIFMYTELQPFRRHNGRKIPNFLHKKCI